ncbi:MAG: DPP IV N-terminal domain-containing protein, partial [Planctomycetes bacterium]|nr:DPP IV N-terminal domain-containing protein [Planctomycetota bacterium]
MIHLRSLGSLLFVALATLPLGAQTRTATRTLTLDEALSPGRFIPRSPIGLEWMSDGSAYTWFERTPGGIAWQKSRVQDGTTETLIDEKAFAAAAKEAGFENLPLTAMVGADWVEGAARITHEGAVLRVQLDPFHIAKGRTFPADAEATAFSVGDDYVAWSKDKDVFVGKPDGTVFRVTQGGHEFLTHGLSVSRVEFGITDGLWWDPTGRRLAFYREDLRPIEPYPFLETEVRPARHRLDRYPMAGRPGSHVTIGVYDTRDDSILWLATDPTKDEYLTNVTWGPDGESLFVAHVNRDQNLMQLIRYGASDGKPQATLITEKDDQWIEPEHGPIFLPDGGGRFLWFSFRDGYRHLYLHEADGHLLQDGTPGDFDVMDFSGWRGGKSNEFFYQATGSDPREKHLFVSSMAAPLADVAFDGDRTVRVEIKEGGVRRLGGDGGQHEASIAPDGKHVLDTWSRLGTTPVVDLLGSDGRKVRRVHEASDPLEGVTLGKESFFTTKTDDGQDLHGYMIEPPERDEGRKYPVLLWVYSGPHSQFVRDEWMGGLGA